MRYSLIKTNIFLFLLFHLVCILTYGQNKGDSTAGWPEISRNNFLIGCIKNAAGPLGEEKAKAYCTCMQQKLELRYPNSNDANKITADTMQKPEMIAMVRSCLNLDSISIQNDSLKKWAPDQYQQYLHSCSIAARPMQNMTLEEANDYCDCITKKIQQKYSYEDAVRLTFADFQTEEWKNAYMECLAKSRSELYNANSAFKIIGNDTIYVKPEVEATFPGGGFAWRNYLKRTLNANTPVDNGAPDGTYTVYIQFIVDIDGVISDAKPLTHIGYGLEKEALRVILSGPLWVPAISNGRKVKAFRKQPITFVVSSE